MAEGSESPVRRTQAERRSRSEEALLDAAAALVAERGVDGASLTSIGSRAGTSRGLPTHHFGTKDAMIDRLAERAQERLSDVMTEAMMNASIDFGVATSLDVLRLSVAAYLDVFVEPTTDIRALVSLWGAVIPTEISVEGLIEADRRAVEGWAVVIERGQVDGSVLPGVDPRAAGVALLALTRGIAALLLIDPDLVDVDAVRQTCDDWISRALAAVPLD